MRLPLTLLVFVLLCQSALSQTVLQSTLKPIRAGEKLTDVVNRIEKEYPVRFFFREEWLEPITVSKDISNGTTIEAFLISTFRDSDFSYKLLYGYAIVILKDPAPFLQYQDNYLNAITRKGIIESRTFGDKKDLVSGKKYVITGKVTDQRSGQPQPDVAILVNDKVIGITNASGRYEINSRGGDFLLTFRSVAFDEKIYDLHVYADGSVDVELEERPTILDEVIVGGNNIVDNNAGQLVVNLVDLKRSAALMGEADIIRQLQRQSGVTSVGEIAGGFNVRGGGADQNLVLFDDIPVFNTFHAMGFFAAFNAEAIRETSFYKGEIPAQYGGRVSSALAIRSKSGDDNRWHGGGSIGLLSSQLYFGGPIKKERSTLFVSARGSYSDWILNTVRSNYKDIQNSSISFADATFRLDHKFSERTQLAISGYGSHDAFTLANDSSYQYRNLIGSLKFLHQFTDKLSGRISAGIGEYKFALAEKDPSTAFDLAYSIRYPSLKLDFNHDGAHKVAFGLQSILYDMYPASLRPASGESNATTIISPTERSIETALYLSDEFQIKKKVTVVAGIRASAFARVGPGTVFHYKADMPRNESSLEDSTLYSSWANMKYYRGLEPRLSLHYQVREDAAVKVGYNRMFQYLHLISNTAAVTPIDIWQSSNSYFQPQVADQFSGGYFRNFSERSYAASVEAFYKRINYLLDFKDGADLVLNNHLEMDLLSGEGKAYGIEFSIQKMKGRLQGSANYTFSRSLRKINGIHESEKINNGETYASNYDQPHVLNIEWRYGISRRHFFSGNFTYHSGRPMSVPYAYYKVDDVTVLAYSERNKYRIPDYHRLDIALIIEGNHKKKKIWDGTWTISIYNVYFRKNAYSVFYKADEEKNLRPYKLSVVGTAVPSVTYAFKI